MKHKKALHAGLLGAGYIAEFHAKALKRLPFVHLQAVCDQDIQKAKFLAKQHGIPKIYGSLEQMLASEQLDAVHLLLPAPDHFEAAKQILNRGVNLFIEKPICLFAQEAEELIQLSRRQKRLMGINHNFLFYPIFEQLISCLRNKDLGPLQTINMVWQREYEPLGTYLPSPWLYENPNLLFLETGVHLAAILNEIAGIPDRFALETDAPFLLANKKTVFRRWNISGNIGHTKINILFSCLPGEAERTINLLGKIGTAHLDFENNTCLVQLHTKHQLDIDRYYLTVDASNSLKKQARKTLWDIICAKLRLSDRFEPYPESIQRSVAAFYQNFPLSIDPRQDPELGKKLVNFCRAVIAKAPVSENIRQKASPKASVNPTILVLGGAGFIGWNLVSQLLQNGYRVRILVRSILKIPSPFTFAGGDAGNPLLEIIEGDILSKEVLEKCMKGIKTVFHLARGSGKSWKEYQKTEVDMTLLVARLCAKHRIQRLIYTSTIDVYYAGNKGECITEKTPIDPKISSRNLYARAKAASEKILTEFHLRENLPAVIFRPGIVIGQGASPFHLGVALWKHHGGVCQYYGNGSNPLPFVLVEDVISALIAGMDQPGLEGESFNLAGPPLLSAQDYTHELSDFIKMNIRTFETPIWRYYAADLGKWLLKTCAGISNRRLPSYHDWQSRTQEAAYACSKASEILRWNPVDDKRSLIQKGIQKPAEEWIN